MEFTNKDSRAALWERTHKVYMHKDLRITDI